VNTRQYKIVYCTPALYSAGGKERVVTAKANYFAEYLGYDVTIIVTEGNGRNSFFPLSKKVKVINFGLNFEALWNISFIRKTFLYLFKQQRYKKLLTQELLKIRPDITISTLRREINFITSIRDGSFKVGELHLSRDNYRGMDDSGANIFKWAFSKWWKRSAVLKLQQLDRFVVLTDDAVSEWPELNNVRMIPDPLSTDYTRMSLLESKRIIAVGRYSYEKGYDFLLRIWSIVEQQFTDWRLDIYGMGDPTPYVKLMDDLSIDKERCHLNSSLVNVEQEYLDSSILVQPSRTEGFGLVLVEAMACGLPVVAFDCENGPRSIITDGENGYLVPVSDIKQFANRLSELMNDIQRRRQMGKKGCLRSERYHIDKIALQWKALFDELMSQQ
jgi:glycosyltransferase involved in cell wall biosynthesis